MATLLVEIGCEELPASACREAERQLPELARRVLGVEPTRVLVTPRRLACLRTMYRAQTEDQWVKGPPVAMREKAAAGFAKRHGVSVDDLEERDGFLGVAVPGKPLAEVLPEQVDEIVAGSRLPEDDALGRQRPPLSEAGALARSPCSTSTRIVGDSLVWPSLSARARSRSAMRRDTRDALRAADVEPDSERAPQGDRRGARRLGGWSDPDGSPRRRSSTSSRSRPCCEASFDERFLQLPARVIETTMQHHIRATSRSAATASRSSRTAAIPTRCGPGTRTSSRAGSRTRSFTFERDVKIGIDALAERLGAITFFAGRGTFADKTERLAKLVEALGGGEAALEAARLAKADQASELVREFPELEGHVGAEYARLAGYPEAVCAAIDEQYLPDAADAPLPQTETGRVLSAADKIDTLNVSFGLGQRPTGSRDPYGLRRAAIGLDRLATEGDLAIPRELMEAEVAEFVEERFEGLLDAPVEYVRAARRASVHDLGGVARLAQALASAPRRALRPDPHCVHAREPARREGGGRRRRELDPALLVEAAEVEVAKALERVDPEIAAALEAGDFSAAVEAGSRARPAPGPLLRGRARAGRRPRRTREPPAAPAQRPRHARAARRALADPEVAALPSRGTVPRSRDTRTRYSGWGMQESPEKPSLYPCGAAAPRHFRQRGFARRFRRRPAAVVSTTAVPELGVEKGRRDARPGRRYPYGHGRLAPSPSSCTSSRTRPVRRRRASCTRSRRSSPTGVRGDPAPDGRDRGGSRARRSSGREAGRRSSSTRSSSRSCARRCAQLCRRARLHYCDLLGQPIEAVAKVSGTAARMQPGGRHPLDETYFRRMEAIEFAVKYDDGIVGGLHEADIVLVGRVPNVQDAALDLPRLPRLRDRERAARQGHRPAEGAVRGRSARRSSGLKIDAKRLAEIRKNRSRRMGGSNRQVLEAARDLRRAGAGGSSAAPPRLPGDRHRPSSRSRRPPHGSSALVEQRQAEVATS